RPRRARSRPRPTSRPGWATASTRAASRPAAPARRARVAIVGPPMPQEKNTLLRVIVPLAALLIGLGVAWSVWRNTARQHPAPPPVGARTPAAPGSDGSASAAPPPEAAPPSAPDAASTTGEAPAPIEGLRARVVPADQRAPYVGLGEPLEDKANRRTQTPFLLRLEFAPIGAGLDSLHLVDHFESIREEEHVRLQAEHRL